VLEVAARINAEEAGAFFGQHAILTLGLILTGLFAANISLSCLLDQLESRVSYFASANGHTLKTGQFIHFTKSFSPPPCARRLSTIA
jgi:hypothetical protein